MSGVVLLTPCLMRPNNRAANAKCMAKQRRQIRPDGIMVAAQCFEEGDYEPGIEYVVRSPEGLGFVGARNALLEAFYRSDYDYAVWMDANSWLSEPTLNDFETLLDAVRRGLVGFDAVFSTLGIMVDGDRQTCKTKADYFRRVHFMPAVQGNCDWMHGLVMVNLRKRYGWAPFIDARCDPWEGTSEDTFFSRLLKRMCRCAKLPTAVVAKPAAKTSTWMSNAGKYAYPPVDHAAVDRLVDEAVEEMPRFGERYNGGVVIDRLQTDSIADLRAYVPRSGGRGRK